MALIEREALLRKVESMTPAQFYRFIMEVCGAYLRQDAAPVVHGRWIEHHSGGCQCSKCGRWVPYSHKPKWCENCGARMDGGEEHEAG